MNFIRIFVVSFAVVILSSFGQANSDSDTKRVQFGGFDIETSRQISFRYLPLIKGYDKSQTRELGFSINSKYLEPFAPNISDYSQLDEIYGTIRVMNTVERNANSVQNRTSTVAGFMAKYPGCEPTLNEELTLYKISRGPGCENQWIYVGKLPAEAQGDLEYFESYCASSYALVGSCTFAVVDDDILEIAIIIPEALLKYRDEMQSFLQDSFQVIQ